MNLKTTNYRVRIELLEPALGTTPLDEEVYDRYYKDKAMAAAEKTGVELTDADMDREKQDVEFAMDEGEKKMTGWPRLEDSTPYLAGHMIRGFFKEACVALRTIEGTKSARKSMRAYKKNIDRWVFVRPHRIPWLNVDNVSSLQRPLRASTPQGERVALANSETVPAGAMLEFELAVFGDVIDEAQLLEWLDYGQFKGLGQWRSSGIYGTFTYTLEKA